MSINGQGHSLTVVKGHSDFKVKCLTFGLYTQVSNSGPLGPLVSFFSEGIRLDVSSESCARQRIHMENQVLFSSKDKSKKLKCHLLQFLFGALWIKTCPP